MAKPRSIQAAVAALRLCMASPGVDFISSLAEWRGTVDFKLDKIERVLWLLGNPQEQVPAIHIAGTNGKGSVSAAIAAILAADGSRVGLTISPHLARLNERIVLGGCSISDEKLNHYSLELKKALDGENIKLSLFEAITVLAFLSFKEEGLDFAVLEVGLGGRLDATNVIKSSAASAIVSISSDHTEILGQTDAQIAVEKAGIIKSHGRVVVGEVSPEAREVILGAASLKGADAFLLGRDFSVENPIFDPESLRYIADFNDKLGARIKICPSLRGLHQVRNMAVAAKLGLLMGASQGAIEKGIAQVFWPARLEITKIGDRKIIIDSAHNEAGAAALVHFLETSGLNKLDLVFGALENKSWRVMCEALMPFVATWRLLRPDSSRALPTPTLAGFLKSKGAQVVDYGEDYDKVRNEILDARADSTVVIAGSMYMAGKLRSLLGIEDFKVW